MVRVEYPKGLLFSLVVNGAAADPREISVLDGTGGRIGIEAQEIQRPLVDTISIRSCEARLASIWRTSSSLCIKVIGPMLQSVRPFLQPLSARWQTCQSP